MANKLKQYDKCKHNVDESNFCEKCTREDELRKMKQNPVNQYGDLESKRTHHG